MCCYLCVEGGVGGEMWEVFEKIVHFMCIEESVCGCVCVGGEGGYAVREKRKTEAAEI